MKRVTLVASLLLGSSAGAQERLVMQPDILDLFKSHHCEEVDDYDNSSQAVQDPPYDCHGLPGSRHMVGWCTRDSNKPGRERKYVLVLYFDKAGEPLRKCSNEIPNLPTIGGLKLMDPTNISPAVYHLRYVDTGKPIEKREPFLMGGVTTIITDRTDHLAI